MKRKIKPANLMNCKTIRVLLVDDHELVRSGIQHLLESAPNLDVVAIASSGENAVELTESLNPDVILMDLNMPGIGGVEAIKRILNDNAQAKIIALSVYDDGPVPQQVIKLGAKGYINKGCPVAEMIKAIVLVHQGKSYLSAAVAANLVFSSQKEDQNRFHRLSNRELQIVTKLLDGHEIPDIAKALSISPKTVNTHRYRVHEKLGIKNDIELVRLAVEQGLLNNI